MQNNRVWERACGLDRTVVEGVRFEEAGDTIVVSVRPDARARGRGGRCGRRSTGYDGGDGRRRWRALDAGTTRVFIEADARRVRCRTHGPTVVRVPWARHDVGHTSDFDATAAWLAVRTSKSATCQLLGVAWRTIGSIITRVNNDVEATVDRLGGLRRIGIDEISYKRGHRYPIVVVDHPPAVLSGPDPAGPRPLSTCSSTSSEQRAAEITHVSADMADWIAKTVAARAPNAIRCADPFHVVAWAIEALDVERRRAWNQAKGRQIPQSPGRRGRTTGDSRQISRSRSSQPPETPQAEEFLADQDIEVCIACSVDHETPHRPILRAPRRRHRGVGPLGTSHRPGARGISCDRSWVEQHRDLRGALHRSRHGEIARVEHSHQARLARPCPGGGLRLRERARRGRRPRHRSLSTFHFVQRSHPPTGGFESPPHGGGFPTAHLA